MMLSTMMVFMAMPIRNSIMTLSTDDNNFHCCDSDGAEDDHDKETRRRSTDDDNDDVDADDVSTQTCETEREREREGGEIKQTERGKKHRANSNRRKKSNNDNPASSAFLSSFFSSCGMRVERPRHATGSTPQAQTKPVASSSSSLPSSSASRALLHHVTSLRRAAHFSACQLLD